MKKGFVFSLIVLIVFLIIQATIYYPVSANNLTDNINRQLENLDLEALKDYLDNITLGDTSLNLSDTIYQLLAGEYGVDYDNLGVYIINVFLNNVFEMLPAFLSIIALGIFCGIIHSAKSKYLADGICELITFVCLLSIILIFSSQLISIWQNTKIAIENIAKLTEIMSPIIITLMLATGGSVSASVYKPAVSLLSSGVISIILYAVLPMVALMTIFGMISKFSKTIKLNKFVEFIQSVIKWVLGLTTTIFGLFISVQGITSATFDGISVRATKYAISNSVPLIGGFLKDGFDLVVAGSVLIKNAVGIVSVFGLFYLILSPVLYMAVFSLLLKLVSALIEPICDNGMADFCLIISKGVTYLCVCLLIVGFMLFITVLLMIFSANAFI